MMKTQKTQQVWSVAGIQSREGVAWGDALVAVIAAKYVQYRRTAAGPLYRLRTAADDEDAAYDRAQAAAKKAYREANPLTESQMWG